MKKLLLLFTLVGVTGFCYGQSVPSIDQFNQYKEKIPQAPTSPSVFAFQQYGNIPISEYTGAPNISVPLHNVTKGEISIPITLNYQSGGIRVNQEASWVGLGWNLSFGHISQTINDLDDFMNYATVKRRPDFASTSPLVQNYPILDQYDPSTNNFLPINITEPTVNNAIGAMASYAYYVPVNGSLSYEEEIFTKWQYDSEPDFFTANFFGHKVDFYYEFDTGDLKILNEKGYKIEKYDTGNTGVVKEYYFVITTPDGLKYSFEKDEKVKFHLSNPLNGSVPELSSRIWKVTKVEDTVGNTVTINYTNYTNVDNFINFRQIYTQALTSYLYPFMASGSNSGGGNYIPNANAATMNQQEFDFASGANSYSTAEYDPRLNYTKLNTYYDGTRQNYWIPSSITWQGGSVNFNTSVRSDRNGLKKLSSITVSNESKIVKIFNFNYSYFNSNTSYNTLDKNFVVANNFTQDEINKRLKLNSITENGMKEHSFEYSNVQLPPKNATAVDYWGFFNGSNNTNLIPNPQLFEVNPGYNVIANSNNKDANLYYAKAGLLEKITYPTKGHTTFEFELNTADSFFVNSPNNPASGNGLRLSKQIDYTSSTTKATTTEYTYEEGKTIAPLGVHRKYFVHHSNDLMANFFSLYRDIRSATILELTSANYNSQPSFSNSNYIGYGKVTTEKTFNAETNGKVVNYYQNKQNAVYDNSFQKSISLPSIRHQSIANGSLLKTEVFDSSNKKVSQDKYSYQYQTSQVDYGVKTASAGIRLYVHVASSTVIQYTRSLVGFYPIFSDKTMLKTKETTTYFDNDSTSVLISHNYDILNRKSNEIYSKLSDDEYVRTEFTYQSGSDFTLQNKLTTPNTITLKKSTPTEGERVLESISYNFYKDPLTNHLLMDELSSCSNGVKCRKTFFNKYDDAGNVLEYKNENGISSVILWGYDKDYMIAKIDNATFLEVANALGISETALLSYNEDNLSTINTLRSNLTKAFVTTYAHDPLVGIVNILDSRGNQMQYEYDELNRLKLVKDKDGNILSENQYHYKN